ncbi:MAG: DUF6034 family protein [Clostridia bacterium]|nr:DUF6034 family protein [Clostridia bacterium]
MKRLSTVLLAFLILFTLACQPTPEEDIVVNKGEGDMRDVVQDAPAENSLDGMAGDTAASMQVSSLYARLNAPEYWTMENTDAGFLIVAEEAPVILPLADKLPVAEAELRSFTQEDIDRVASVLFEGKDVKWHENIRVTKEQLMEDILYSQERLTLAEEGGREESYIQHWRDRVNEYQEQYLAAPYEADLKQIDLSITTIPNEYREDCQGVSADATIDGDAWTFYARTGKGNYIRAEISTYSSMCLDEPYKVQLSKEDAIRQASELVAQITDELTVCHASPVATPKEQTERNWGWQVIFMRGINGVPTAYASEQIGGDMDTTVSEPVGYEQLTVVLDDKGLCSFSWHRPMQITGFVSANAELLSFDEVARRAIEHIAARWKYNADTDKDIRIMITRVELGLWRIANRNGGYYFVPVWHFFSDAEHSKEYYESNYGEGKWEDRKTVIMREVEDSDGDISGGMTGDPYAWGSITVNAIDGSIIDKDKGY